jgi:hypothetical protein
MKMMSWSRYHCLSRSIPRVARQRPAMTGRKIRRHPSNHAGAAQSSSPAASGVLRRNCFQSLMRMFRTGVRPADTDV